MAGTLLIGPPKMRVRGDGGITARVCRGASLGLILLSCPAMGAFDQSGILGDPLTTLDTTRVFKTEFASTEKLLEPPQVPEADIKKVLDDHQSRISPAFRIPDGIEPLVGFWLDVYT